MEMLKASITQKLSYLFKKLGQQLFSYPDYASFLYFKACVLLFAWDILIRLTIFFSSTHIEPFRGGGSATEGVLESILSCEVW